MVGDRLRIVDGINAYWLTDTVTGLEVCLGDGVGINFGDDFTNLTCGMPGFVETWQRKANEDLAGYFEVFFYDLHNLEIYDRPEEFADRYTVVVREATLLEKHRWACADLQMCLFLPGHPGIPQGFSQWGHASLSLIKETGKQIYFLDLPKNVQRHIAQRLEEGE